MKARDLTDLLLLAAIWGASFLFMCLLVPVFTGARGALVLGETVSLPMLIGGGVILTNTALVLGLLPRPRPAIGT